MLKKLVASIKRFGLLGTASLVSRKVKPARAQGFAQLQHELAGTKGIEVGGPSEIFTHKGLLPLYPIVDSLDNCNFSAETVWECSLSTGRNFNFREDREPGMQFVTEATALDDISDGNYGFLLSSHMLEHTANPIAALLEWRRVLCPKGILVLVVPHFLGTFDHRRPVTPLSHLIADFEKNIGEDDLTHLEEILENHDFELDPGIADRESLRIRSVENQSNRCLHHHVFDSNLVVDLLTHCSFEVLRLENQLPEHIIAIARKSDQLPQGKIQHYRDFELSGEPRSPFRDKYQAWRTR